MYDIQFDTWRTEISLKIAVNNLYISYIWKSHICIKLKLLQFIFIDSWFTIPFDSVAIDMPKLQL